MLYEVESSEGTTIRDVTYNPDGTVVSVEETLPVSEFPEAVRIALDKGFPKARITKSEKVTKGSLIQYEVLFTSGKASFEVVFDSDGKLAKKEEIKENQEKD